MSLFSNLDRLQQTSHKDAVTHPIMNHTVKNLSHSLSHFGYEMPLRLVELVRSYGINASPVATQPHPHPFHKTIENHLLYQHWKNLATSPSSVMFMKDSKFQKLAQANPNFLELINYIVTPKDLARYASDSPHLPTHDTIFIHDALMYFPLSEIADLFQKKPSLKKIYASLVLPPESLFSLKSLYPDIYQYVVHGNNLHYTLENNPSSSYQQPLFAADWLQTSTYSWPTGSFCITLLESWGPIHSLLISRGSNEPEARVFRAPEMLQLPPPVNIHLPTRDLLVPTQVYNNLFTYVHAVRTLRISDPHAYVRNLQSKSEHNWVSPIAWEQLAHFAVQASAAKPLTAFEPVYSYLRFYWRTLRDFLWQHLPSFTITSLLSLATSYSLSIYHKNIYATLALTPIPAWLIVHFQAHRYPQTRSDKYNAYYHPEPFLLRLTTKPAYGCVRNFLKRNLQAPNPSEPERTTAPEPINTTPETPSPPAPKLEINPIPSLKSLIDDPSARGPTMPFSKLYPEVAVAENHLLFTTRRRSPTAPAPALPATNLCLLQAIVDLAPQHSIESLFKQLAEYLPDSQLIGSEQREHGYATDHLALLAWLNSIQFVVHSEHPSFSLGPRFADTLHIYHTPGHWSAYPAKEAPRLIGSFMSPAGTTLLNFRDSTGHLLPFQKVHSYSFSRKRASNLAGNMKNNFDGVVAHSAIRDSLPTADFWRSLDSLVDNAPKRTVSFVHIVGFPGCGKSFPVKQLLMKNYAPLRDYLVVVPTVELRNEWKHDLKVSSQNNWRISTWELALAKVASVAIVDEVYKLPNGFIDLLLVANPNLHTIIALGDPCQGAYHSLHPSSNNHLLIPETVHLRPYADYYCLWSHRIPRSIAELLEVPTHSKQLGKVTSTLDLEPGSTNLVSTHAMAAQLVERGHRALTMSSSQGLTFDHPVVLHVDRHASLISDQISLVAVTRSKQGIIFTGAHHELAGTYASNTLFYSLLAGKRAPFLSRYHRYIPHANIIYEPISTRNTRLVGSAPLLLTKNEKNPVNYLEDIVHNHENLLPPSAELLDTSATFYLPPTRLLHHRQIPSAVAPTPSPPVPDPLPAPLEAVYAGVDYQTLASTIQENFVPESKERSYGPLLSNQFPHLDANILYGSQTPSLVAPVHSQKKDPTLLPLSISKRLRFRPNTSPYFITPKDHYVAQVLFESLCFTLQRSPHQQLPFQPLLFAECINLNDYAQLSKKTRSVLVANMERSDPDWRFTFVRIFTKTQHKINSNNIFGDWKACQTLALMHDFLILTFGPVKKYQRALNDPSRSQNIFLFGGKTPRQLLTFVQKHFTNQASVENDYTAFDQSQLGEALQLEVLKMQQLSIPQQLIDIHVHIKTSLQCQLGPLTCMRFTGEPGTYDDNTDYNLAILYTLFSITHHTVLVSGDDSVVHPIPSISPRWSSIEKLLLIKFKLNFTEHPLFCSYYLGPAGIIRAPTPLFHKSIIAQTNDELPNKLCSYLSEFAIGHSLGDELWTLLPAHEYPCQEALFDFFCRVAPPQLKILLKLGHSLEYDSPYHALPQKHRRALLRKGYVLDDPSHEPNQVLQYQVLLQNFFQEWN